MGFDTEQIKAIESDDLNEIILAVAGSGKTTTTIACALRAINHPAITRQLHDSAIMAPLNPKHIRVASFTNIAADTFRARIDKESDGDASDIHVSTLDKFAIEIIHHIYPNAQFDQNEDLVARTLYYKLNYITGLQDLFTTYSDYISELNQLANSFSNEDKNRRKMYYNDYLNHYLEYLISNVKTKDHFTVPLSILYQFAIVTMIKHKFIPELKMLIVDEIQDTSDAQFNFLSFLRTQLHDMRFIGVGDVSQSMYRWNQAQPERVSNFIQDFNASIYTLPNNYRSHPEIIDYANSMLENNLDNISGVSIIAKSRKKSKHYVDKRVRYHQSMLRMFKDVKSKIEDYNINPNEIAIIARNTKPLRDVAKIMDQHPELEVPIDMSQQENNKDIKFFEFLLRLFAVNYAYANDNKFTYNKLEQLFDQSNKYYFNKSLKYTFNEYLEMFRNDVQKFNEEMKHNMELLRQEYEFKMSMSLFSPNKKPNEPGVRLSTVHGIKGDEYRYVYYIPEQNTPLKSVKPDSNLTAEEREVFWGEYAERQNIHYVAITRAIDQFTIVDYYNNFKNDLEKIENAKLNGDDYNIDTETLLKPFKEEIENAVLSDEEYDMIIEIKKKRKRE